MNIRTKPLTYLIALSLFSIVALPAAHAAHSKKVRIASLTKHARKTIAPFNVVGPLSVAGRLQGTTFFKALDENGNACRMVGPSDSQIDFIACETSARPLFSADRPALIIPSLFSPAGSDGLPDDSRQKLLSVRGFALPGVASVRVVFLSGGTRTFSFQSGLLAVTDPLDNAIRIDVIDKSGAVVDFVPLR